MTDPQIATVRRAGRPSRRPTSPRSSPSGWRPGSSPACSGSAAASSSCPGLVLAAGMDQRLAHGTSLAAVLPISIASLLTYAAHDNVDWTAALWLSIGAVAGAVIGTKLLHVLPAPHARPLFAGRPDRLGGAVVHRRRRRRARPRSRRRGRSPWSRSGSAPASSPACSASAAGSSWSRR